MRGTSVPPGEVAMIAYSRVARHERFFTDVAMRRATERFALFIRESGHRNMSGQNIRDAKCQSFKFFGEPCDAIITAIRVVSRKRIIVRTSRVKGDTKYLVLLVFFCLLLILHRLLLRVHLLEYALKIRVHHERNPLLSTMIVEL